MTAPVPLREQIAALIEALEIIAANGASIKVNGWRDEEVRATQTGLEATVVTLGWLARNEPAIRAALAKPVSKDSETC